MSVGRASYLIKCVQYKVVCAESMHLYWPSLRLLSCDITMESSEYFKTSFDGTGDSEIVLGDIRLRGLEGMATCLCVVVNELDMLETNSLA